MEVVKYKPRYKKAIVDMAQKNGSVQGTPIVVQGNLEHPDNVCYCALEKGKFKGAILGIKNGDSVVVNFWVSVDKHSGIELARKAMLSAKLDGFKYAIFYRENEQKFYKKEL